ncbi:Aminoacyl-tRNA hydrolase [Aphelenchoides fujianensis]|nr:Aminoacyl-tRNA hydrolase [Aphelenchoides fujianensis]
MSDEVTIPVPTADQPAAEKKDEEQAMGTRVMYLLLRKDLETALKWPVGAICTQAAHAATACLWTFKDDPEVIAYCKDLDHMHKITLAVESEDRLMEFAKRLEAASVQHSVWIEDNMPVCIAIKPQPRAPLKSLLGRLQLYK